MEDMNEPLSDFFDYEPTLEEKLEMRKASKPPSEWLKLLCRDWAIENIDIVEGTDLKFLSYKTYLKGKLTSQLLCRISIPEFGKELDINTTSMDFWKLLGIHDEFDIRHIISEVERFCSLYSIRNSLVDTSILDEAVHVNVAGLDPSCVGVGGAPGLTVSPLHNFLGPGLDMTKTTAAAASPIRREARRLPLAERREMNEVEDRTRDAEPMTKEATREEKRHQKLLQRQQREQVIKEQKDAALRRAADLVKSNRIPISITRGSLVAKSVQKAVNVKFGDDDDAKKSSSKKSRSDIVVSTASDLDQIVQHAKNLFYKYNTIARAHNKKVSWAMISKELGIHVKVREKYARMHARALERNFDFQKCGGYKIKDHPEIFLAPTSKKSAGSSSSSTASASTARGNAVAPLHNEGHASHNNASEVTNLHTGTNTGHGATLSHNHPLTTTNLIDPSLHHAHIDADAVSDQDQVHVNSFHHENNKMQDEHRDNHDLMAAHQQHSTNAPLHHNSQDHPVAHAHAHVVDVQVTHHMEETDHGQHEHHGNSPDDHQHLSIYPRDGDMSQHITDDQVAAAVDAAIKIVPVNQPTEYTAEATEVALTAGTHQFVGTDGVNGRHDVVDDGTMEV